MSTIVRSARSLNSSVVSDTEGFAALEGEWQDLYHDSPCATPFQTWAWLYSWWEYYGADYELRLVTIRDGESLVGLLPLMLERGRFNATHLLFVGSGQSIYLDVIAREGWEERVAAAGRELLPRLGRWQVADLRQLRPDAVGWKLFDNWGRLKSQVWQASCPVIDVRPWDDLLCALNQKQRSNTRRAFRRAEQDGVSREIAPTEDAEKAAGRLVSLHRESWRGRGIVPEHLTERFESLLVTAATRMTASGVGAVSEFWRGDEVVASHFLVLGHDFAGGYLGGATGEALRRYSIHPLYMKDGMDVACDRDLTYFDLMWGEEPHKLRWSTRAINNSRAVLGRNPVVWAIYAAYHLLRSRSARYVNSGEAPAWLEKAVNWYRSSRSKRGLQSW